MPMPQLNDRQVLREQLRKSAACHKCQGPFQYIHDWKPWCKVCLDCEMYPNLVHLTQEERDELRRKAVQGEGKVSLVNAGNLTGKIGF